MVRPVRRWLIACSMLFVSGAVGGCTGSNSSPVMPSGSASPSSAVRSLDPLHPVVVRTSINLQDFGEKPNTGEDGVFVVGKDYIVRPDGSDTRTIVVTRRSDNSEVLRHKPDQARFVTDFAGLDGHVLVLVDEDSEGQEPNKLAARAAIYDLVTGKSTAASKVPGAPGLSPYGPQATVSDGKYYYGASVNGGFSNCVGEIDLVRLTGRTVECGASGDWMFYTTSSDHGASWVHFHGSGYNVCREGRRIQNGTLGPVGPANDCGTFDTAALGSWQIWGTMPLGNPKPETTLRATDGTNTVQLGSERQFSMSVCGGYVYWDPEATHKAVARWRPGSNIELVYEVKDDIDNTWIYADTCADGIATFQVDHYHIGDGSFTARLLALAPTS